MPSILARTNPGLDALHDEILVAVPELATVIQEFDTYSHVEQQEYIKVLKNDASQYYLAFFLRLHAAKMFQEPVSTPETPYTEDNVVM